MRPTLTRSLLSLTALTASVAGLGLAFVAGTTWGDGDGSGGTGPWRPPGSDASPVGYTGSDLRLPGSCDDLLASYVDRGSDLVGAWGWGGDLVYPTAVDDSAGLASSSAESSSDSSSGSSLASSPTTVRAENGATGTNVQEAGVDEPDVVKTDGRTLYRIEDDDLVTYDVTGPEVVRLGSTDLPGGSYGAELLLSGEVVVTIAQDDDETEVAAFDVSDPATPALTRTATYDAGLVTARLHEGVVRLVVQAGLPDLDFTGPDDDTSYGEAERDNVEAVRDSEIEDWLPTVAYDGGADEQLLDCADVAVPDDETPLGTLAVVGFDAPAPESPSTSAIAVDTDLVYASADQLYLATTPWGTGPVGCVGCVTMAEDDGLAGLVPSWLRFSGSTAPVEADGRTHLYAFDLDGIDTTFAAGGLVDGAVRDRWSIDATDDVLRVAVGASDGDNAVVTLRQEGDELVEVGRLDDLGPGEEIQSVRWFDDLAIVVTFRQVDPLYAIDLTSDQPVLLGELKIPGFSAYLHPLGERRLLGLGEGPSADGGWGAQAGLFDVTDLTDPRQIDVLSYGAGTQALATADPRQLTWLPESRTVLSVVADWSRASTGYVSVLTLGEGAMADRIVEMGPGTDLYAVRLVPLPDGRVVLATADGASFLAL